MLTKKELLKYPNYLTKKYQNEIYRQLVDYMEKNKISQKEIAKRLDVSNSYVSQILNGNFNFTLTKLIELGLLMRKVPVIGFVDVDEYERGIKVASGKQEIQKPVMKLEEKNYRANHSRGLSAHEKKTAYRKKK
jgi:transcriptional regulator with XRE-family HTH domain